MFDIAFRAEDLPWVKCAHCRKMQPKATARDCPTCDRPVCAKCRERHAKCPIDVEARARRQNVVDDEAEW